MRPVQGLLPYAPAPAARPGKPRQTVDDSDLWHGDMARDWAGRELDDCPEARPEQVEEWHRQADLEWVERARGRGTIR